MISLVVLPLVALVQSHGYAQVRISTITYEGWKGCYRVSNGLIDMVVVPQVGRIMRFGEVGKRNLLWEGPRDSAGKPPSSGGWMNWGGDKVWPAPQALWGWPPEMEYDGSPWQVAAMPNGVRMTSGTPSAKLGVRFERTITIERGSREAVIRNVLFNESGKPARFAAWEICQVNDPDACLLPVWKSAVGPKGWRVFDKTDVSGLVNADKEPWLSIRRNLKQGVKYGSGSPVGMVCAVWKDYRLSVQSAFRPNLAYPDEGCAQEIYTSSDPLKYCELEVMGPLINLKPGQTASITVTMRLDRR